MDELREQFGPTIRAQATADAIPTFWVDHEQVPVVLRYLKTGIRDAYKMLYDITAIDERVREHREGQPPADFTVMYHLFSFERNEYVRIKTALRSNALSLASITPLWPAANWYEREVWDMFGIVFAGHPHLERLLMPRTWVGHPLCKDHPARATEMGPFQLSEEKEEREQEARSAFQGADGNRAVGA